MPCRRIQWCPYKLCAQLPPETSEEEREQAVLSFGRLHDNIKAAVRAGEDAADTQSSQATAKVGRYETARAPRAW